MTTWTIARREIADAVGTGRAPLLFVLVVIMLGTGMLVLRNDYQARVEAHTLIRPDGTEPVVAVAPSPLSVFARGLDDAMGRRFEFSPAGITVGLTQASANPLFGAFPTPDWLFLFRVVLALLAFLAGYDLICREKAQGTLKLLLAGGASRASVAAGKWLGNWLVLVVPVMLAALLWLTLAGPLLGLNFRPGDGAAIAAFLGLGILYLTVCFTLAAALSALFHDQTTALVTAVLVWAVLVFVVPGSGVLAARQAVAARPSALVESELGQAFGRGMMRTLDLVLADGGGSQATMVARYQEGWGGIHQEMDRIMERAEVETARLVRVAEAMVRVSPAGAFDGAATRVLGTSIHDDVRFRRRVLDHKNAILPAVFAAFFEDGEPAFPAFQAPQASVAEALTARAPDLAALLLAGIVSVLAFFTAVREYDVR